MQQDGWIAVAGGWWPAGMKLARVPTADEAHELKIHEALADFNLNPSQLKWRLVTKLVRERSPEQVARMEKRKGLA